MRYNLRSVLVLATTTLLDAIRSRLLLVSLFFAVILVALSVAAASVSLGMRERLVVDVGLAAASAVGGVVAIALGVSSFAGELTRRTAYPVLVRPLPRWGFVLGKHLGATAAMGGVVTCMVLATAVTAWVFGGSLNAAFWGSLWLLWLEMLLVCAIAVLFSTLATPVLAASYSVGFWLAGNLANDVLSMVNEAGLGASHPLTTALQVFHYLVPDLSALSLRAQAANALPIPDGLIPTATLYAVGYTAALLALAMASFSRRKVI